MLNPVLALLLVLNPLADGKVHGRVIDASTEVAVIGAEVRLTGDGTSRVTRTSITGDYEFTDVAAGDYRIQVIHPGYESADIRVVLSTERSLHVDVTLAVRPVEMAPIVARALRVPAPGSGDPAPELQPPRSLANTYANRLTPRSASPLSDMVAAGPRNDGGGPDDSGGQYDHVLYLWGSGTDRGRVFVDGATLIAPLHMGGLMAALDPDLMQSAALRSGGSSSRYDGGASYIMDYVTRRAESQALTTSGEFDPITTRILFEAPLSSRAGVMIGARRVNSEIVDFMMDGPYGYGYADLLVRANSGIGQSGTVRLTAVATRERIELPRDQDVDDASWNNLAFSLGWRDRSGPSFYTLGGTFSRGVADLPLLSAPGGHMVATVERRSASGERHWTGSRTSGLFGLEFEHLYFDRMSHADSAPFTVEYDQAVSCIQGLPCFGTTTAALAGYTDFNWRPSATFSAQAGLRVAYRPETQRWDALPRASVTTMLGQRTAVTLAAGRYSQPFAAVSISPAEVQITLNQTSSEILRAIAEVAYANQVEFSVVRSGEPSSISAIVYVRHHEPGPGAKHRVTPGVDVTWSYDRNGLSAALGYSLAIEPSASDTSAVPLVRHLATASIGAAWGPMNLRVNAAFGHGLPVTSIVLEHGTRGVASAAVTDPEDLGAQVTPTDSTERPYFRLDAELSARWTTHRLSRRITVAPYAKLVNALSHRDAMFYYYDRGVDAEPRPLARLGAVPVLGIRWSF
ncbi:MAG TPA: carboxypeptidase regulatory-like domain-containing protein [Longimicrobiales bacterium]|nr:carboxypeptidase regulatory-like domain-containing protein [Longimicrobiales bacterium]